MRLTSIQFKYFSVLFALLLCFFVTACGKADDGSKTPSKAQTREAISSEELQFTTPTVGDPIAIFTTDLGTFSAVLYPNIAPQACDNFIGLAQDGFFDGTPIDRVISGFCVQAGKNADGKSTTIWKGHTYPIEPSDTLHHYAGALCTALNEDSTASSPFYVVQAYPSDVSEAMVSAMQDASYRQEVIDAYTAAGGVPYLDYADTVFGQIYEGMETIDTIALQETDENGTPTEAILIQSVEISTYQ